MSAIRPDSGRQQLDHVLVARGQGIAANSRRLERLVRVGIRWQPADGRSLQPPSLVGISLAVERGCGIVHTWQRLLLCIFRDRLTSRFWSCPDAAPFGSVRTRWWRPLDSRVNAMAADNDKQPN
jgi:hypothetical protein